MENKTHPINWKQSIRRSFFSGILVLVPLIVTGFVLYKLFEFTDSLLQPVLTRSLNLYVPGLGILVTVCLIFVVGLLARNILAQKTIRLGEKVLVHIPLAGSIYGSIKQILSTFAREEESESKPVVLVPWPSEELWALGFLNGKTRIDDQSFGLVLILSSINPTTGLLTVVPAERILLADLPVEEAMKLIISGGIVTPKHVATRPLIGHRESHPPLRADSSTSPTSAGD